jgi:hypothetical protein
MKIKKEQKQILATTPSSKEQGSGRLFYWGSE